MTISPLRRHLLLYVILLIGLTALVWGRSLSFGFAWDDYSLIVENPSIGYSSGFAQSFTRSFWDIGEHMSDTTRDFYRPLVSLSYRIDYAFWQLRPWGFHLTNLILHLCNVLLVFLIAVHLTKKPMAAFVASLIWAIHPAKAENICWISGRTDLICGLGFFAAYSVFLCWQRAEKKSASLVILTVICFLLALLGKEMAITLPALIVAHAVILGTGKRSIREHARLLVSLVLTAFVYIGLRIVILGEAVGAAAFGSSIHRLLSIPMLIVKYLGVTACFVPIDPHHAEGFVNALWHPWFMMPLLLCLLYGWIMIKLWRAKAKGMLFFLIWFPITILPVLYAGSFGDVLYADRFLFIPSLGLLLASTMAIDQAVTTTVSSKNTARMVKTCIVLVCCVALAGYSYIVSSYWHNSLALFIRASKTSPDSAYVHYNLANSFARLGLYEQACESYADAIALKPDYTSALINKAAALNKLNRFEEALYYLAKAVAAGDTDEKLLGNSGIAYAGLNQHQTAMRFFEMAQNVRVTHWVYLNMAKSILALDPIDAAAEARKCLYKSQAILPTAESHYLLAFINNERGNQSAAVRALNSAYKLLRPEHSTTGLTRDLEKLEQALIQERINE